MTCSRILGLDFGGVITDRANDNTDNSFLGDNYLRTSAVSGALESIAALVPRFHAVYIVSTAGKNTERKTREWMEYHDFYQKTGIIPENVRFCRYRQAKARICRELDVTHFVDDHMRVLWYLDSVPNLYLLNADQKDKEMLSQTPQVKSVDSWGELRKLLEG